MEKNLEKLESLFSLLHTEMNSGLLSLKKHMQKLMVVMLLLQVEVVDLHLETCVVPQLTHTLSKQAKKFQDFGKRLSREKI